MAALRAASSPDQRRLIEQRLGPDDETLGIRMRDLFDAARNAKAMPLDEVEGLFASRLYEVRMGAVCILDFRAKAPRVDDAERERLYRIYLDRHDRITTWDMVDRAAPSVVGGHLAGRSAEPPTVHFAASIGIRRLRRPGGDQDHCPRPDGRAVEGENDGPLGASHRHSRRGSRSARSRVVRQPRLAIPGARPLLSGMLGSGLSG